MQSIIRIIYALMLAVVISACGSSDSFTVECRTTPDFQRMILFTYAAPDGIKQSTIPLEEGKAKLIGQSPSTTLVSVSFSNGTPIASCLVKNGDDVTVNFRPDTEGSGIITDIEIKGSKLSKQLLEFETSNDSLIQAGYSTELNRAVADYIIDHTDSPVSTVLLSRYYDARDNEAGADSLMTLLSPEARPATLLQNYGYVNSRQLDTTVGQRLYSFNIFTATDSVKSIRFSSTRQTLLAFPSSGFPRRHDLDSLRSLWAMRDTLRLNIVEVALTGDSAAWRHEIQRDSVDWIQAWTPGNVASTAIRRLAVPRQPFYILIDSIGNQIYRGSSFRDACDEARRNMSKRKPKAG